MKRRASRMLEKMDSASLEKAASKLKLGDVAAFELLFQQLFQDNFNLANSLLNPGIAASKKITSEALFMLWAKHSDFDSFANIDAFLKVTVRNKCLDYSRHCRSIGEKVPYELSDQYSNLLPSQTVARLLIFAEAIKPDKSA